MYWPVELVRPVLRAPEMPWFSWRITTILGSSPAMTDEVSSVEPSSTTISSQS